MKKYLLQQMLRNLTRDLSYKEKMRWNRTLKYFAVFSFMALLLGGGLLLWGTVSAVSYMAKSVEEHFTQENLLKNTDTIRAVAAKPITTKECLDTMGSVLSANKLLTVPLAQNLKSVKVACWEKTYSAQPINNES